MRSAVDNKSSDGTSRPIQSSGGLLTTRPRPGRPVPTSRRDGFLPACQLRWIGPRPSVPVDPPPACTRADPPAGAAEAIFEPFGRAPNAAERHIPGMGLGLYICREIAELHGGRIWAESAGEDRGTTFAIWLPFADSPLAPKPEPAGSPRGAVAPAQGRTERD